MPPEFDPAWEYFVPDPEVVGTLHPEVRFDALVCGYRVDAVPLPRKVHCNRVRPVSVACAFCGGLFAPARAGRVYCSKRCHAAARIKKTDERLVAIGPGRCPWCGREVVKEKRPGKPRRFCSDRHRGYFYDRKRKYRAVKLV